MFSLNACVFNSAHLCQCYILIHSHATNFNELTIQLRYSYKTLSWYCCNFVFNVAGSENKRLGIWHSREIYRTKRVTHMPIPISIATATPSMLWMSIKHVCSYECNNVWSKISTYKNVGEPLMHICNIYIYIYIYLYLSESTNPTHVSII